MAIKSSVSTVVFKCDFQSPGCIDEVSTNGSNPFKKILVPGALGVPQELHACDSCLTASGIQVLMDLV